MFAYSPITQWVRGARGRLESSEWRVLSEEALVVSEMESLRALSKNVVRPGTCQGEHLDADASHEAQRPCWVTTCAPEPSRQNTSGLWSQSSWIHVTWRMPAWSRSAPEPSHRAQKAQNT